MKDWPVFGNFRRVMWPFCVGRATCTSCQTSQVDDRRETRAKRHPISGQDLATIATVTPAPQGLLRDRLLGTRFRDAGSPDSRPFQIRL